MRHLILNSLYSRLNMETSPVGENSQIEIDICTPSENLIKQHCQEITPDNPTQPETKPLSGTKKVKYELVCIRMIRCLSLPHSFWKDMAMYFSMKIFFLSKVPAVGFPPKLSKRKLFGHNVPVPETLITGIILFMQHILYTVRTL